MAVLDAVAGPADLRGLDATALDRLADELRETIVESVAANGGHLGSNLGAVELTLALHRVFDSPHDLIVWDTGHQAYAHKLVTGRREGFARLRHSGGVSGYPSRSESEHDVIENSHASASLSYAYGLAVGRDAGGSDRHVVAVIGDGALTGGMAYEALNNLGCSGRRVIVVVNDNARSYAPTVSRLVAGRDGDAARFFAALGFDYAGPVDGHDIPATEHALRTASEHPGPSVVHVLTRKGRGYRPAEDDAEKCLHDVSPFDVGTRASCDRRARSRTPTRSPKRCSGLADQHPELVALTAAMPGSTGLLPFAARHPDRCFDVGIAEQHAVTAAAGMAMQGLRPVVAIYSTFLNRAWDQVVHDVGLHRLPVVFCVDRAGITGDDGPSHHGVYDLALLTKVPGMTVFAPSSYAEVGVMLREALRITSGPVALRWPKTPAAAGDGVGTGTRATTGARGARPVHPRGREDGRGGTGGRRDPRRRRHPPDDLGRAGGTARRAHAHGRGPLPARRHRGGRHRRRRHRVADHERAGATTGRPWPPCRRARHAPRVPSRTARSRTCSRSSVSTAPGSPPPRSRRCGTSNAPAGASRRDQRHRTSAVAFGGDGDGVTGGAGRGAGLGGR